MKNLLLVLIFLMTAQSASAWELDTKSLYSRALKKAGIKYSSIEVSQIRHPLLIVGNTLSSISSLFGTELEHIERVTINLDAKRKINIVCSGYIAETENPQEVIVEISGCGENSPFSVEGKLFHGLLLID